MVSLAVHRQPIASLQYCLHSVYMDINMASVHCVLGQPYRAFRSLLFATIKVCPQEGYANGPPRDSHPTA